MSESAQIRQTKRIVSQGSCSGQEVEKSFLPVVLGNILVHVLVVELDGQVRVVLLLETGPGRALEHSLSQSDGSALCLGWNHRASRGMTGDGRTHTYSLIH